MNDSLIISLDVGTTNIKCIVYLAGSNPLVECDSYEAAIQIIKDNEGKYEIDADHLYDVCLGLLSDIANKYAARIVSFGVTTQRGSILLWRKDNGKCLTNFVTWNDTRLKYFYQKRKESADLVQTESFQYTALERLKWCLFESDQQEQLKLILSEDQLLFGTVETWLLWKLTNCRLHVVDKANISLSGMYSIEKHQWDYELLKKEGIPLSILPNIIDTHGSIGLIDGSVFGLEIPINAVIGDQQASVYGCYCHQPLQAKVTFGTGTFFDINIGSKYFDFKHKSVFCYLGWQKKSETPDQDDPSSLPTYIAEIGASGNTEIIAELFDKGIISSINEIYFDAKQIYTLYKNRDKLDCPKTRAILEAVEKIAFKFCKIFNIFMATFNEFKKCQPSDLTLYVNGNLTRNNFLLMIVSSLLNIPVSVRDPNATAKGAAMLCQQILSDQKKIEIVDDKASTENHQVYDFTQNEEFRLQITSCFQVYLEQTKNDSRL